MAQWWVWLHFFKSVLNSGSLVLKYYLISFFFNFGCFWYYFLSSLLCTRYLQYVVSADIPCNLIVLCQFKYHVCDMSYLLYNKILFKTSGNWITRCVNFILEYNLYFLPKLVAVKITFSYNYMVIWDINI